MLRLCALLLLVPLAADAAARDYTFSFDSHTLPAGKAQAFFELIPRTGRREYHARFDSNGGAMIGVTRSLETYLQLDTRFQHDGLYAQPSAAGHVTSTWRYHFLDPQDPLGFVVQLRLSLGYDELVVGGRFIADWRTGGLRLALNAAFDRTIFFQDQQGVSSRAEETLALGYQLGNTLLPHLEVLAQQSMTDSAFAGSAFFVGGGLTFQPSWGYFTLGMVTQVAAVKPDADVGDGERLELRDHERFIFKFAIGVNAL